MSQQQLLVGYEENLKDYKIYEPVKKVVTITRVAFIQNNLNRNLWPLNFISE